MPAATLRAGIGPFKALGGDGWERPFGLVNRCSWLIGLPACVLLRLIGWLLHCARWFLLVSRTLFAEYSCYLCLFSYTSPQLKTNNPSIDKAKNTVEFSIATFPKSDNLDIFSACFLWNDLFSKSTRVSGRLPKWTHFPQHVWQECPMEVAQGLEPPRPGLSVIVSSLIDCVASGHSHSLPEMNFSPLAGIIISIVFLGLWQNLSAAVAYSSCRIRGLWWWQKWCCENSEAGLYTVTHLPLVARGRLTLESSQQAVRKLEQIQGPRSH